MRDASSVPVWLNNPADIFYRQRVTVKALDIPQTDALDSRIWVLETEPVGRWATSVAGR